MPLGIGHYWLFLDLLFAAVVIGAIVLIVRPFFRSR